MADDKTTVLLAYLGRMLASLVRSQGLERLFEIWKTLRKIANVLAAEGTYEVLEYEGTLELLDQRGKRAQFRKREKVRYLQNHTIAYQDQAWGDGEILLDYKCAPGTPVDHYRPGQKTYILISLREVKRRGDVDEFRMEWGLRDAFLRDIELWETEVSHHTRSLKVELIFPADRPPLRVTVTEAWSQKTNTLAEGAQRRLPDGRWRVTWGTDRPRLYERYTLQWAW
jgi:hypothetical protein